MKTKRILADVFLSIIFTFIFVIGTHVINTERTLGVIFFIIWLILCMCVLPLFMSIALDRKWDKDLNKIKAEERLKGAKMFLSQVSSTERFKKVTNQTLPLISADGEKYGTTTTYGDLSDFLDREFKV